MHTHIRTYTQIRCINIQFTNCIFLFTVPTSLGIEEYQSRNAGKNMSFCLFLGSLYFYNLVKITVNLSQNNCMICVFSKLQEIRKLFQSTAVSHNIWKYGVSKSDFN